MAIRTTSIIAIAMCLLYSGIAFAEKPHRCHVKTSWMECARGKDEAVCEGKLFEKHVEAPTEKKARKKARKACEEAKKSPVDDRGWKKSDFEPCKITCMGDAVTSGPVKLKAVGIHASHPDMESSLRRWMPRAEKSLSQCFHKHSEGFETSDANAKLQLEISQGHVDRVTFTSVTLGGRSKAQKKNFKKCVKAVVQRSLRTDTSLSGELNFALTFRVPTRPAMPSPNKPRIIY